MVALLPLKVPVESSECYQRERRRLSWCIAPLLSGAKHLRVAHDLLREYSAKDLYVSQRTVETHLTHIFLKLDLWSRTELVAEANRWRPP
jgi:FixJ family two-component response regulator